MNQVGKVELVRLADVQDVGASVQIEVNMVSMKIEDRRGTHDILLEEDTKFTVKFSTKYRFFAKMWDIRWHALCNYLIKTKKGIL